MHHANRVKLLGRYHTPRFHYGDVVFCELRGEVKIVGLTTGRIPWPQCLHGPNYGIILYGDLARAVRRESSEAIKHWFGVGDDTVWKWRKAFGVEEHGTPGTSALRSRWAPESCQSTKANKRRMPTLKSPERAAKIAASKRGQPMPHHVLAALLKANKGRKVSAEARRKMSEAHKRRGTRPPSAGVPWTADEDALLGTMKDGDVAERTGRSEEAVSSRRYVLNVAAFTKRRPRRAPATWSAEKDRLLGTMPDGDLGRKLRCSPMAVFYRRKRLKIAAFRKS